MRDPLREQDIERALDVRGGVRVDVADDGTATVTLGRDGLDRLTAGNPGHYGCRSYEEVDSAESKGFRRGYGAALNDVRALAAGSAA